MTLLILAIGTGAALAHDNGQYAQSDPSIRQWFNSLRSQKGLCCSFADGRRIDDVDWRQTSDPEIPFQAFLDGVWIDVPKDAVITDGNKVGYAIVWPLQGRDGKTSIRCFIPGVQT
jgi:hypothetical protein